MCCSIRLSLATQPRGRTVRLSVCPRISASFADVSLGSMKTKLNRYYPMKVLQMNDLKSRNFEDTERSLIRMIQTSTVVYCNIVKFVFTGSPVGVKIYNIVLIL